MKSRTRPDDMKLITQLIAILIVIKLVSDLLNYFRGKQVNISLFKFYMISNLCKKYLRILNVENLPKYDKGRSFIVFIE